MNNQQSIKAAILRIQFILLPAFFGGFMGRDLLRGSLPVDRLITFFVVYGLINLMIYFIIKSQLRKTK